MYHLLKFILSSSLTGAMNRMEPLPPSDLYHEGREHANREDIGQWLDHLFMTPSERVRDLKDRRSETFKCAYGFLPLTEPEPDRSKEEIAHREPRFVSLTCS